MKNTKHLIWVGLIVGGLILAGPSQAAFISYEVGGWTDQFPGDDPVPEGAPHGVDGYPGDTVEFQAYSDGFDLVDGAVYQKKINTLKWTIDYTWAGGDNPNAGQSEWGHLYHYFDAIRTISFDGNPTGSIAQEGLLENTWHNDYLGLDHGPISYFFVDRYRISVKALGLARVGGSYFQGGAPWEQPSRDVMAEFRVDEVPEPATVTTLGLLLAAFGVYGLWGRRKARSQS